MQSQLAVKLILIFSIKIIVKRNKRGVGGSKENNGKFYVTWKGTSFDLAFDLVETSMLSHIVNGRYIQYVHITPVGIDHAIVSSKSFLLYSLIIIIASNLSKIKLLLYKLLRFLQRSNSKRFWEFILILFWKKIFLACSQQLLFIFTCGVS